MISYLRAFEEEFAKVGPCGATDTAINLKVLYDHLAENSMVESNSLAVRSLRRGNASTEQQDETPSSRHASHVRPSHTNLSWTARVLHSEVSETIHMALPSHWAGGYKVQAQQDRTRTHRLTPTQIRGILGPKPKVLGALGKWQSGGVRNSWRQRDGQRETTDH